MRNEVQRHHLWSELTKVSTKKSFLCCTWNLAILFRLFRLEAVELAQDSCWLGFYSVKYKLSVYETLTRLKLTVKTV